jgi:hypothetical protein
MVQWICVPQVAALPKPLCVFPAVYGPFRFEIGWKKPSSGRKSCCTGRVQFRLNMSKTVMQNFTWVALPLAILGTSY